MDRLQLAATRIQAFARANASQIKDTKAILTEIKRERELRQTLSRKLLGLNQTGLQIKATNDEKTMSDSTFKIILDSLNSNVSDQKDVLIWAGPSDEQISGKIVHIDAMLSPEQKSTLNVFSIWYASI